MGVARAVTLAFSELQSFTSDQKQMVRISLVTPYPSVYSKQLVPQRTVE